jgi:hypothetical protein
MATNQETSNAVIDAIVDRPVGDQACPCDKDTTWGPRMKIDPEADKVLERMGRDALLAEGARQHGVDRPDGRSIGAGYVQYWLRRQTEAHIAQEARDRQWMRCGVVAAIVAAVASVLALVALLHPIR